MNERESRVDPSGSALDPVLARLILVQLLEQVPEFLSLWNEARQWTGLAATTMRPYLLEALREMSPAGRGALAASEVGAWHLYEESAQAEAVRAGEVLAAIGEVVQGAFHKSGIDDTYKSDVETIAEPLGVPGFADLMILLDFQRWGLADVLTEAGPIEGPFRELLEAQTVTALTGMRPVQLANAKPGQVRATIRRQAGPFSRHLQRFDLSQRVALWFANVVYGITVEELAARVSADPARVARGYSSYEWVRVQVREASKVLGAQRRGRPRKGGVLRQWKLMAES